MPTSRLINRALVLLTIAASISCSGSDHTTGPDPTVSGIRIYAPPAPMVVDESYHLTAISEATGSDLSTDPSLTWSSSNATVATVTLGIVTAVGPGTAEITAEGNGKGGKTTISVTTTVRTLSQDVFTSGVLGFSSARNGGELDAYIVGPAGLTRITANGDQEQFDGWSPNGSRIAVLRFPVDVDFFTSHTLNADGTDDVLVSNGIVNWAPDWKHRGSIVANQVMISNADGSGSHTVGPAGYYLDGPWWSHDGSHFAFAYSPDAITLADIYVANADGSGLIDVTNTPALSELFADWSPDGSTLAIAGENPAAGVGSGIFTVSTNGTGLKQLTRETDPRGDYEPQWSPDGKRIMFTTYLGATFGVYIIAPDGGNPQRFSPAGLFSGFGKWSPDGSRIAFTGYNDRSSRFQDIFVMTTDRKSMVRITKDAADNLGPFWKP